MDTNQLSILTTDQEVQKSDLVTAGQAANQIAANYLFADYQQRRAPKTIRTQTATLLLWVQHQVEVGAASKVVAMKTGWGYRPIS